MTKREKTKLKKWLRDLISKNDITNEEQEKLASLLKSEAGIIVKPEILNCGNKIRYRIVILNQAL